MIRFPALPLPVEKKIGYLIQQLYYRVQARSCSDGFVTRRKKRWISKNAALHYANVIGSKFSLCFSLLMVYFGWEEEIF